MTYTINQNVDVNAQVDIGNLNIHGHTITNTDNGSIVITTGSGSHLDVTYAAHISNLVLSGNDIGTKSSNLNLTFTPHGSGIVKSNAAFEVGNFNLNTNTISSTNTNGHIILSPNGTGNVGIGISSPDTKLHIYDNSSSTAIFIGEDGTTDKCGIVKYLQGDGNGTGFMVMGNWGDDLDNNGTGIVVKKGGNVGIGTTSPGAPLHIEKGSDGSTRAILATASDSDFKIRVVQQSSSNATGALQGNFGLYHGTGESFVLRFRRGGSGNDGSLSFYTNGADRFNFGNNGDMTAGAYYNTSDDRLKIDESIISDGLGVCMKLRPQIYTKKDTLDSTNEKLWKQEGGFIAQEIYYDIPELRHIIAIGNDASPLESIKTSSNPSIDPDYSSWGTNAATINYVEIIPYTVSAIQELSKNQTTDNERILELEGDLATAQETIATQDQRIATLEAQVSALLQHTGVTI